jgi:ABC-type Na+ efflux pump permease subunit
MGATMKNFLEYLRIIGVLARNDILQGLKNKNILVLFFSVAFIIIFYNALPSLTGGVAPTMVYIYDAAESSLPAALEEESGLEVRADFAGEEQLRKRLAHGDRPEMGLVIPADFDSRTESGEAPELRGIVAYWLSEKDVAGLKAEVEGGIAAVLGQDVSVAIDPEVVYGPTDDEGAGTQAAMALIFSLTMIGISLVPHLMFDEKKARTLDVLMVSPASETQIAAGKLLAGLFYSGTVMVLAVIVNHNLIVHWGLFAAILAVYAMFCVSLGLILGTAMESRAQFSIWAWVIILPLFMPVIIYLLRELVPDVVGQLLPVIPSVTVYLAMRYVFAQPTALGAPLLALGWILVWTAGELGIVSWLLRRRDRAEAGGKAEPEPKPEAEALPVPPAPVRRPAEEGAGAAVQDGWRASLRIVAAIAGKDVREAYRNRMIFSVLIGTVFLALNGSLLPALVSWGSKPAAVVFDEGKSAVLREAAGEIDGHLAAAESRADMETEVVQSTGTRIGIVIPSDFDTRASDGGEIRLKAYAAHWVPGEKVRETADYFAGEIGRAVSADVRIDVAEQRLYPSAETGGQPVLNLLTQFLMLVVVGFAIVPLLLVEEKESRTMEMLTVSPAGYAQILAGKTLAGMIYGLAVGAAIALINLKMIVHWDVLVLTVFLGTLLLVSIGLLIGVLADSPTSAAFWASPLLLLSIVPVLLEGFFRGVWPAWLTDVLSWFPTSVIMRMFRLSVAGDLPAGTVWQSAAVLAASAAAVYALVVAVMRRKYSV